MIFFFFPFGGTVCEFCKWAAEGGTAFRGSNFLFGGISARLLLVWHPKQASILTNSGLQLADGPAAWFGSGPVDCHCRVC